MNTNIKYILMRKYHPPLLGDFFNQSAIQYHIIGYDDENIKYCISTMKRNNIYLPLPNIINDDYWLHAKSWTRLILSDDFNYGFSQAEMIAFLSHRLTLKATNGEFYLKEDNDIDFFILFGYLLNIDDIHFVRLKYSDLSTKIFDEYCLPILDPKLAKLVVEFLDSLLIP